jgi:hypothetical protein
MSELGAINIEALVDPVEKPGLIAAAEQLSDHLGAAAQDSPWRVRLNFRPMGSAVPLAPTTSVAVVSLLPEAGRTGELISETEARWRSYLSLLKASGAPVFVCTVFRHVADRDIPGVVSPVLERIRRLNLMAADLSHDLDVAVIDIDRAFAHIGGRRLQTDYRLSGVMAAEVAGHTIAWSLLSSGLDDVVDPALQERAKAILGDLQQIDALIGRRLAQRAEAGAAHG